MALAYSRIPGTTLQDAVQIARDGPEKIFYSDEPINLLHDYDEEEAARFVTSLVNEAADELNMLSIPDSTLLNVDSDVMANEPPTNRYGQRIYARVQDRKGAMESKLYDGEDIMVIPRCIPEQHDAIYVFGPSGAGKSSWAARYAKEYMRENPGNHIYLFSRKKRDRVFDHDIPALIRVELDRNFIRESAQPREGSDPLEQYANSLVIFDDFEKIKEPAVKKAVHDLKDAIFGMGRQHCIDIISIQHKGLGGPKTIAELCEASTIVCFPRMNLGESKRLLRTYLCFDKMQMARIFDDRGRMQRWIAIIRPNIIVAQDYIKIVE